MQILMDVIDAFKAEVSKRLCLIRLKIKLVFLNKKQIEVHNR